MSTKHTPKYKFEGHHISNFIFLHDNTHIVSSSLDGTMRKWNLETGLLIGDPWEREGGGIWALELSPDGQTIACGRIDGSVQTWNTNGKMIGDNWASHGNAVWSLSWSPSGGHLASGSEDGTILIRKAGSREVEIGPIQTNQHWVCSLANSPSGDRIASGGYNETICIWDCSTGKLLVGPIGELGYRIDSVVWSSDSSKLYCASEKFARVLDSTSGAELHRFQHDDFMYSVALSPKHNILACVGVRGVTQLWDTESYQPLGHPFHQEDREYLHHVSFSRDGRYLAYGGNDNIILQTVQDEAGTQQNTLSPNCFNGDATNPFVQVIEGGLGDPRDNFFRHSESSSQRSHSLSARRLWNSLIPSRHHLPAEQHTPLQPHVKRSFFKRHITPQPITARTVKPKMSNPTVRAGQSADEAHNNSTQSSPVAAQLYSESPKSTPHTLGHLQTQITTQPAQQEHDYGCWSNFRYTLSRTPRHPHSVVSSAQSVASGL